LDEEEVAAFRLGGYRRYCIAQFDFLAWFQQQGDH
jgi:hypothetical protein